MRATGLVAMVLSSLLCGLVGCGSPSLLITPVSNTSELEETVVSTGQGWFAPKIALIEVEGMLVNAQSGGLLQAGENPLSLFTQQMNRAAMDPSVKAVVLRVNSPGGTVTTSDTMYQTVLEFREKTGKPVIASTQEVAASGAYYVCCAADRIVAQPTSVVGSIGVIFNTFNVEGTMGMIGVRTEAIKSGPLKDMGSPFDALSPEERAVMQRMVDEYFERFKAVIVRHRPIKTTEALASVSDGRVFSGEQALQLGLVDQLGRLNEAIALARQASGAQDAAVVMYRRPYGYGGSIYASSRAPLPKAEGVNINLADAKLLPPTGFYYLWRP